MSRVLIVGAGIAGLMAARQLQDQFEVTILDKSRGVGGRMATRRLAESPFDHGAQYFTARDESFVSLVGQLADAGILRQWATGFMGADGEMHDNDEPRYVAVGGMTAFPKALAEGVTIHTEKRVHRIEICDEVWRVVCEDDSSFEAEALIMTPPAPQTLGILARSHVVLPEPTQKALEAIQFNPCYALMLKTSAPSAIPEPGGLWMDGDPIAWMADNHQKGILGEGYGVTIHASPEFTRHHWATDFETVAQMLQEAAGDYIQGDILEKSVQRWRYSIPTVIHPERCIRVDVPLPLVLAGDAFGGPRVEGAALSGLAAAEALSSS